MTEQLKMTHYTNRRKLELRTFARNKWALSSTCTLKEIVKRIDSIHVDVDNVYEQLEHYEKASLLPNEPVVEHHDNVDQIRPLLVNFLIQHVVEPRVSIDMTVPEFHAMVCAAMSTSIDLATFVVGMNSLGIRHFRTSNQEIKYIFNWANIRRSALVV